MVNFLIVFVLDFIISSQFLLSGISSKYVSFSFSKYVIFKHFVTLHDTEQVVGYVIRDQYKIDQIILALSTGYC